jgi:hypothetical protein
MKQGGTDAPFFGFAVCGFGFIAGVVWGQLGTGAVW